MQIWTVTSRRRSCWNDPEARLRAFLKALKYGRRGDFENCIDIVLTEALALDRKDLFVILTYLDKGPMAQNHRVLHEALDRLVPEQKDSIVGWFTRNYYEKGREEGEAKLLTCLLEKRFGVIPAALQQRIASGDAACIETWAQRVLDAPDLQSVFDST